MRTSTGKRQVREEIAVPPETLLAHIGQYVRVSRSVSLTRDKCHNCGGIGWAINEEDDYRRETHDLYADCSLCGGEGVVSKETETVQILTKNKIVEVYERSNYRPLSKRPVPLPRTEYFTSTFALEHRI